MTVLSRYLARAEQYTSGNGAFDEFAAPDGSAREGWSVLLDELDEMDPADLLRAQSEVARLLEDDNVTYTPSPASTISIADRPDPAQIPLSEPQPCLLYTSPSPRDRS